MHDVVNRIVEKFATQVQFVAIHREFIEFTLAEHLYFVDESKAVFEIIDNDGEEMQTTAASIWVEKVLRGMVRDDAGVVA